VIEQFLIEFDRSEREGQKNKFYYSGNEEIWGRWGVGEGR
jgi:hypothetical protein